MLRRFLLTLVSSWAASPIGIVLANVLGAGQAPVLLSLLLAMAVSGAFQLYINETLAAAAVRSGSAAPQPLLALVLGLQFLSCVAVLLNNSLGGQAVALAVALAALLCVNSATSYRCAIAYYKQVATGSTTPLQALVVGALPGLCTLVLLVLFSLLYRPWPGLGNLFVLAAAVVPTLLQWAYLERQHASGSTMTLQRRSEPVAWAQVLPLLALIMIMSLAGALMRAEVAAHNPRFASLVLVLLGLGMTVLSTVLRARHLAGASRWSAPHALGAAVAALALGAACAWAGWLVPAWVLALLATQIVLVLGLDRSRHAGTLP